MNTNKTLLRFLNNNYTWIISSILTFGFMITFMIIFNVTPFGTNTFVSSDCYVQTYPMLAHLQYVLNGEGSIFYTWNNGLGGDFLPTYFYYIASPIYLLVGLIKKSDLLSFLSITIAFKIVASAGTFAFYLSRRNGYIDNDIFHIALSCAYALSNYMCGYYYQVMWFDALVVFPLILLGYKKLRENKPILYVIALSYSLYANYYITYIVCLFLVLLFILDEYSSLREFIVRGIRFTGYSTLAAGMVAVSLWVSYIGLGKTSSSVDTGISHRWYGNFFAIIRQHFILSNPVVVSANENDVNIYCGSFVVLFVLLYLFNNRICVKDKIKKIVLVGFLLISMNESVLNYLWHGFHVQNGVPNRFSIVYIVLVLVLSSEALCNIDGISARSILVCSLIAFVFPVLCYLFVDFNSIVSSYQIIYFSMALVLLYASNVFIIRNLKNDKKKTLIKILITSLMVIEILFNALITIKLKLNNSIANEIINHCVENAKDITEKKDGSVFYRSDYSSINDNNFNMYYNIFGVGAFESTLGVSFVDFLNNMREPISKNRIMYFQMKNYTDDILGLKYIYCIDGCKDYEYDHNYKKINSINGVDVYENINALSLGFGVNKNIQGYTSRNDNIVSNNISSFYNEISGTDNLLKHIIPQYSVEFNNCSAMFADTDFLSFKYHDYDNSTNKIINVDFDIANEGVYFLDIEDDNQDLLTIKINGKVYKEGIWLTNGMNILGKLYKGDHVSVEISDNNDHIYKVASPVSEVYCNVYKLDMEKADSIIKYLSKNQMKISSFSHNTFSGTINLDANQMLFMSIPYDKGWHIFEDGKEIKTEIIADTFLGADLGEGTHNLTFRFVPEGLYFGLIVTVISWIIFVIVIIMVYTKKK